MSLADEILDALPAMMLAHPSGPTVPVIAKAVGAQAHEVRPVMDALEASERAVVARYEGSRAFHLVPLGHCLACKVCRLKFERGPKSKRVTCSRSCAVSFQWKNPETKAKRSAAISAQKQTPEGKAATSRINKVRWSRPGEREKMSEQNKRLWADPEGRAKRSVAIKAAHRRPEKRAMYAELRRKEWADPEQRKKRMATTNAGKRTPEYRAKFSAMLKARWQDPIWREKWTEANKRRNDRVRGIKLTPEQKQHRRQSRLRNRAATYEVGP